MRAARALPLGGAEVLAAILALAVLAVAASPSDPALARVEVLPGPGVAPPADGGFDLPPGGHIAFASSAAGACPCLYSFRFHAVPPASGIAVRVLPWSQYLRLRDSAAAGDADPFGAAGPGVPPEAPAGSVFPGPERAVVLVSRTWASGAAAGPSAAVLYAMRMYGAGAEGTLTYLSGQHALVEPLGVAPLRAALELLPVPLAGGAAPYLGPARLRLLRSHDAAKVHNGFPYTPLLDLPVPVPSPPSFNVSLLAYAGPVTLVLLSEGGGGGAGALRVRAAVEPEGPRVEAVRGRPEAGRGGAVAVVGTGFGSIGPLGDRLRVRLGDDWCLDAAVTVPDVEIGCWAPPHRPGTPAFFIDVVVSFERVPPADSGSTGAFAFSYAGDVAEVLGTRPLYPYPPSPVAALRHNASDGVPGIRRRAILSGASSADSDLYDEAAELFVAVSLPEPAETEAAAAQLRAELQARPPCAERTILLYEFSEFYGLGASSYWFGVALRVAHERNWTLVASTRPWLYWPENDECGSTGFECFFEPVSSCRPGEGRVAQHWGSHMDALGGGEGTASHAYRNAVPEAYRALGLRWYKGQLLKFLLRPRPRVLSAAEALQRRLGMRPGEPCVTLHARRSPDKRVASEAAALRGAVGAEWAPHVTRWSFGAPMPVLASAVRDAAEAVGAASVFVSADSDLWPEIGPLLDGNGTWGGLRLLYDRPRSQRKGMPEHSRGDAETLETLASLWTARSCGAFAGSFASCFGRLAFDLLAAHVPDHIGLSVDAPWYSHP
eukprot:tig00000981_g5886.t1